MGKANKNVILVPTDFSPQSIIALEQAVSMSYYFNSEILLLHVLDDWSVKNIFWGNKPQELEIEKKLQETGEKYCSSEGIGFKVMVSYGNVSEKVIEVSKNSNIEIIVMGVNTSGSFKKKLVGNTALEVVKESSVPLITIKGTKHNKGCRNIVFPLDLSEESTQKITNAIDFAKKGNSAIRILSVLFTTDDFLINKLTKQMEEVRSIIESNDIECTAELIKAIKEEETTAQVINDYAHKVEGDLIIIMTQQEKNIKESFLSSTAAEIITSSDVPVMSIIPRK
jgi:nucleotide-binding universal stress UspA family protein